MPRSQDFDIVETGVGVRYVLPVRPGLKPIRGGWGERLGAGLMLFGIVMAVPGVWIAWSGIANVFQFWPPLNWIDGVLFCGVILFKVMIAGGAVGLGIGGLLTFADLHVDIEVTPQGLTMRRRQWFWRRSKRWRGRVTSIHMDVPETLARGGETKSAADRQAELMVAFGKGLPQRILSGGYRQIRALAEDGEACDL